MRYIRYTFSLICLLCLAASASAKPLAVDRVTGSEPLPPYFSVLPDPQGKLTYEAVATPGSGERFVPLQKGFPLRGTGPIWLRLSLTRAVAPGSPGYNPAHLAVNLGELPPGTTKIYLPAESELPGATGAVAGETVMSHEKIFLPDPGLTPINIYIRMDETPGLWFTPIVGPAPLNSDTFFPIELVFLGLIPAAAILCLVRAGKDRTVWPLWVALFLGCVLLQDLLPLPGPGSPFKMTDLPALLAPGVSLMILTHVGRLLLRTRRNSPGADLFLLCGMVPGIALCLMPLAPGWSWLVRLFPLWPLPMLFFLPIGIAAMARKQNGGLGWTGACFFAAAGAACTLATLFVPLPDLAASAWLWGLALAGVCLTLAGSPREQRTLAEAIEAEEAVLHNLPPLQLDAFTKGRVIPAGPPRDADTPEGEQAQRPAPKPVSVPPVPAQKPAQPADPLQMFDAVAPPPLQSPKPVQVLDPKSVNLPPSAPFPRDPDPRPAPMQAPEQKPAQPQPVAAMPTVEREPEHTFAPEHQPEPVAQERPSAFPAPTPEKHAEPAERAPEAEAPTFADPALEFSGVKTIGPNPPELPKPSPVVTIQKLEHLEAAANQWLAEAFGDEEGTPTPPPAQERKTEPAPKPAPFHEPEPLDDWQEPEPAAAPIAVMSRMPEPKLVERQAPSGIEPGPAQPAVPKSSDWQDSDSIFAAWEAEAKPGVQTPTPKPTIAQVSVAKPAQAPESKPTAVQFPEPGPEAVHPTPTKPSIVQAPPSRPVFTQVPESKPTVVQIPEPKPAPVQAVPSKPTIVQAPAPRPVPTQPVEPRPASSPAPSTLSEPIEAAAYRWLDAAFADTTPSRPSIGQTRPTAAPVDRPAPQDPATNKWLAESPAAQERGPAPTAEPEYKEISLKDEDFSSYNMDGLTPPPQTAAPHPESSSYVFNLQTLMREVQTTVEKSASAKGLLLSWFVAPTVPPLLVGDTPRLRQALSLLLQNAVQACRRGAVQVTVRQSPDAQDEPDACTLLFAVSDSGSDRRTDAGFFQAWELASHSGGTFRVQYRPDAGTTIHFSVRFRLPTAEHKDTPREEDRLARQAMELPFSGEPSGALEGMITEMLEPAPAKAPAPDSGMPGVILADTTTGNKKLLGHYLKNLPIEIAVAQRPNQAQALYAERPARLVIFDADMPEADTASSIITIRRLERENNLPQTAILALVGHDAQMPRMRALGCSVELRKPFTSTSLRNALAAALPQIAGELSAIPETPPGSTYSPLDPERRLERLFVMPGEAEEAVEKPSRTVSLRAASPERPEPAPSAPVAAAPMPSVVSIQRAAPVPPAASAPAAAYAQPAHPAPAAYGAQMSTSQPAPAAYGAQPAQPQSAPAAYTAQPAPTAPVHPAYRPTPVPVSGPVPTAAYRAASMSPAAPVHAPAYRPSPVPQSGPMPGAAPSPAHAAAPRPAPEPVLPGERALLNLVGADMSMDMHEPQPIRMHEPVDLFSEAAMAPPPPAASAPAQRPPAPQNELPGMPLADLDESVPLDLLPLVPGLIHALRDALRLCNQGVADNGAVFVQEAAGRLAEQSDSFDLKKLAKIARYVERAAEADDLEAVRTLLEDLDNVTQRYVNALQGAYDDYIKGAP